MNLTPALERIWKAHLAANQRAKRAYYAMPISLGQAGTPAEVLRLWRAHLLRRRRVPRVPGEGGAGMRTHPADSAAPEIEHLRAEVKHWKDHAEEAGQGFSQVCRDYARVSGRNVALIEGLTRVQHAAEQYARGAHILGHTDEERRWLDLLALIERADQPRPIPPEASDA